MSDAGTESLVRREAVHRALRSVGVEPPCATEMRRALRDLVELAEGYHDYILKITGSVDGFLVIERAKAQLRKEPSDTHAQGERRAIEGGP